MNMARYDNSQFSIILCNVKANDEQAVTHAGYQRHALNQPLANMLLSLPDNERTTNVRETVLSLIPRRSPIYLVDDEMLFDPRYEIDVHKLLYEISRKQRLVVKWCGRLVVQVLVYAEPSYPEYKKYPIADYDIICVD